MAAFHRADLGTRLEHLIMMLLEECVLQGWPRQGPSPSLLGHLPPQLRARLLVGPELDVDQSESQSLLANLVALRHRIEVVQCPGEAH